MKKFFLAFCVVSYFVYGYANSQAFITIYPEIDNNNSNTLPENFRTSNDALNPSMSKDLSKVCMSGSQQFTPSNFPRLLSKLPSKKVVIFDLRQESHGFINGIPISWRTKENNFANAGKTLNEIIYDECNRLHQLFTEGSTTAYHKHKGKKIEVKSAISEQTLVESFGLQYYRIPVTDNHKPESLEVDRFINIIKGLPEGSWLHFHCKMGAGRTTTFMVLYDIMKNGKTVSLNTIIRRQRLIGGSDLLKYHLPGSAKNMLAQDRLRFIHQFYHYWIENSDGKKSFTDWLKAHSNLDESRANAKKI